MFTISRSRDSRHSNTKMLADVCVYMLLCRTKNIEKIRSLKCVYKLVTKYSLVNRHHIVFEMVKLRGKHNNHWSMCIYIYVEYDFLHKRQWCTKCRQSEE